MDEKFSLKDFLFNKEKVNKMAGEIKRVHRDFADEKFVNTTVKRFPDLELKARISWISKNLHDFLPDDYKKSVKILVDSLPLPNDPDKTDNDFGDFIYAPYSEFVARYGCDSENLNTSLEALREITMRFSAEDAIRYFIDAYPEKTLTYLYAWSEDENYHVRRLTSEGSRPKLPWSQKINIPYTKAIPILDNLFSDKTRYVTRSVANHLNDLSKLDPDLVIKLLDKWQKSEKQDPREMEYIITHSLRTLIKQGDKRALKFLKFSSDPQVSISNVLLKNTIVKIGEAVEFNFRVRAEKDERLIIDYIMYFQNKTKALNNKKVFKLAKKTLNKGEEINITKKHSMRAGMTTRKLYPGEHQIEIQINGRRMANLSFQLAN